MFSASCHYGLQAMFYIALHSTEKNNVDLSEIAAEQSIPKHFLSKILQLLVKHKLLVSRKGPNGGYNLNRPADEISLLQIVEAIDGLDIFDQCGIGFRKCNPEKPCPIHNDYKKIRDRVYKLFEEKTLVTLNEEIKNGESMGEIVKPSEK
ncbi:RrF2 family transcriptional regulator [Fodinibius saliphilus]|uniref:RrF2 family transcriptional regulator n=1 Tax=Fodinibius saliphilus TaxID=1920650 RepID=UPI0011097C12|nr:Rrf2 family transcriptional regulator [Fodinibius saliphilus]